MRYSPSTLPTRSITTMVACALRAWGPATAWLMIFCTSATSRLVGVSAQLPVQPLVVSVPVSWVMLLPPLHALRTLAESSREARTREHHWCASGWVAVAARAGRTYLLKEFRPPWHSVQRAMSGRCNSLLCSAGLSAEVSTLWQERQGRVPAPVPYLPMLPVGETGIGLVVVDQPHGLDAVAIHDRGRGGILGNEVATAAALLRRSAGGWRPRRGPRRRPP